MLLHSLPVPSPYIEAQPYFDALNEGRLETPQCRECAHGVWPPIPLCSACGGELEWIERDAQGTIYSLTVVHQPTNQALVEQVPYAVVLVEVAPGVRPIFNLREVPAGDEVALIGKKVRIVFGEVRPDGQREAWVELAE